MVPQLATKPDENSIFLPGNNLCNAFEHSEAVFTPSVGVDVSVDTWKVHIDLY